jgi:hypothetical protein
MSDQQPIRMGIFERSTDPMAAPRGPLCVECLSPDVTVKLIDGHGLEAWFCAADWAANQELHGKIMAMLEDATSKLGEVVPGE